ncbi:hypothetical protein [Lacticaseibacillus absianus]|uniref:hypothetical protein n=1 Tax=Lacticaseibacillus absianus TaxID=2729623 RepID=UPI0015CA1957|nr:hypothetical protein [Lacticaseibacillus absianus]
MIKHELARLDDEIAQLTASRAAEWQAVTKAMQAYVEAEPTGDTLGLRHLLESLNHRANDIDDLDRTLAMKARMRQLLRLEKR